ncbi:hypothetical protein BJ085DRAFT_32713, partial [Dimargaris cristalligena]
MAVGTYEQTILEAIDQLRGTRHNPYVHIQSIRTYFQCQRESENVPLKRGWSQRVKTAIERMIEQGKLEESPQAPARFRLANHVTQLLNSEERRLGQRSLRGAQRGQLDSPATPGADWRSPTPQTPHTNPRNRRRTLGTPVGTARPPSARDSKFYRRVSQLIVPREPPRSPEPSSSPQLLPDPSATPCPGSSGQPTALDMFLERSRTRRRHSRTPTTDTSTTPRKSAYTFAQQQLIERAEFQRQQAVHDKERTERFARRNIEQLQSRVAEEQSNHAHKQAELLSEVAELKAQLHHLRQQLRVTQSPPLLMDATAGPVSPGGGFDFGFDDGDDDDDLLMDVRPISPVIDFGSPVSTSSHVGQRPLTPPPDTGAFLRRRPMDESDPHLASPGFPDDFNDTFVHIQRPTKPMEATPHQILGGPLTPPPTLPSILPTDVGEYPAQPHLSQRDVLDDKIPGVPRGISSILSPATSQWAVSPQDTRFPPPDPAQQVAVERLEQLIRDEAALIRRHHDESSPAGSAETSSERGATGSNPTAADKVLTAFNDTHLRHLALLENLLQNFVPSVVMGDSQALFREDRVTFLQRITGLFEKLAVDRRQAHEAWSQLEKEPPTSVRLVYASREDGDEPLRGTAQARRTLDQIWTLLSSSKEEEEEEEKQAGPTVPEAERWSLSLQTIGMLVRMRQMTEKWVGSLMAQLDQAQVTETQLQQRVDELVNRQLAL